VASTAFALPEALQAGMRPAELASFAEVRALFPGLDRVLYFNTASYTAGSIPVRNAYTQAVGDWFDCRLRWEESEGAAERARALFAHFVNASPDAVALIPCVSTAAGVVASQLPPAQPGESVLVSAGEFSSNYYPWVLLRERGYEVRCVRPERGKVAPEAFSELADERTRLIAVSAVQAATGYRVDLSALAKIAGRSGAWLFVDGAQAVGAVDVDVVRDGIDFLAAPSHKYLLGTRGMGYLYIRPTLLPTLRPVLAGWRAACNPLESLFGPGMALARSASKLDTSLAWFPALAEPHALNILDRFGLANALQRNCDLTQCLHDTFGPRGLLAYEFPTAARSPIVALDVPDAPECFAHLQASGCAVSLRSEHIRVSAHFYNTHSEIAHLAELIDGYLERKRK